jgi:hypothetical protein
VDEADSDEKKDDPTDEVKPTDENKVEAELLLNRAEADKNKGAIP